MCSTICCLTATWASFSPDQRGQGLPCVRGALQASAVIWARCSAVKLRRVPARGASRTLSVCSQRCRQCLTVLTQQPTCRAISAFRQGGCCWASRRSRARWTSANGAVYQVRSCCRCTSCSRVRWRGYLGTGPGIRRVLLIKHQIGGLSYVRALFMSNPPRIYLSLSRFKLTGPPTPRDTEASNAYAVIHDSLGPVYSCSLIRINSNDRGAVVARN